MNYVIAVSGGVDSVVLLDMVAHHEISLPDVRQVIVAHFDHGIREDSGEDAKLVEELANRHSYTFEVEHVLLGKDVSEEQARNARYTFLRQVCEKYNATLVTAHHQDDLIETMIINLARGTSWRGLISLRSSTQTIRPLLGLPKSELLAYAKRHNLAWHEDSTNKDVNYLRNYIRLKMIPKIQKVDPLFTQKLLRIHDSLEALYPEIKSEIKLLVSTTQHSDNQFNCLRYKLIMWPQNVAHEYIYTVLRTLDSDWHPEQHHIHRALLFAKTSAVGTTLQVTKKLKVVSTERYIEFQNR